MGRGSTLISVRLFLQQFAITFSSERLVNEQVCKFSLLTIESSIAYCCILIFYYDGIEVLYVDSFHADTYDLS